MDWGYIFKHWIGTLVLTPILSQIGKDMGLGNPHEVVGLFEMCPITLSASTTLSLPTLLFYLFVYHIAERSTLKMIWVKLIVILWGTIGICLTLYLLDPWLILSIGSYYIIANSICGLMFKIKRMPKEIVYSENT